jgi:hypothetical protein
MATIVTLYITHAIAAGLGFFLAAALVAGRRT